MIITAEGPKGNPAGQEPRTRGSARTIGCRIVSPATRCGWGCPGRTHSPGINVERSGLFTGVRGKQIAGRCVFPFAPTGPFPYQQEWKSLVAALETALRLHRHQPGTLPDLDRYLHQRTGGMIGSLSHLIRAGAITAILDGCEAVTRDLLEGIPVDHAAQSLREGAA